MDVDQHALALSVGAAVRAARREAKLSLTELAAKTGLSQPFLSQAENGHTSPSVANLFRIAQALGTTAHSLLEQGSRTPTSLVRDGEGRRHELAHSATVRFCVTGSRTMEPNEVTAGPHSSSEGPLTHAGEEFVYVLEGKVEVTIAADDTYVLTRGDTLYYPATVAHQWFNTTDRKARFLITSSPPGF